MWARAFSWLVGEAWLLLLEVIGYILVLVYFLEGSGRGCNLSNRSIWSRSRGVTRLDVSVGGPSLHNNKPQALGWISHNGRRARR